MLLFDHWIYQLSLMEVRKQVQEKMLQEQNGMDKESIDTIREKVEKVSMLLNFNTE